MTIKQRFASGNSKTEIDFDVDWLVLDLGSGHSPHPRANILVDRYWVDDGGPAGRSGRPLRLPEGKLFVIADATALPFADKQFEFVICSHIAEHIHDINGFCSEINRVGCGGYLETPSKLAEILRHPPYHLWYVTNQSGDLLFEPAPRDYPLGILGKLIFSIYFYGSNHAFDKDVFAFARGLSRPWHYGFVMLSLVLHKLWRRWKSVTFTRLLWRDAFAWRVTGDSRGDKP